MLQIVITNNIRIRGCPVPLRAEITKALTYNNPEYIDRKKKRRPTWGIESKIPLYLYDQEALVVPRGYLPELVGLLQKNGYDPLRIIQDDLTDGLPVDFGPWNPTYQLKEDQQPAVDAAFKQNGILVAPAGAGKTVLGLCYVYMKRRPALWLTHTKDLLYQSAGEAVKILKGVGRIGILGDGKTDWGDGKLIVATVQTLAANPRLIDALKPLIGTVVIDEAHHFPAPAFIDVAGKFPAVNMLGITATPTRKDGLEMYMYRGIGPQVYKIERDGLYDAGRLIKPEVKFIYTDFTYDQKSSVLDNVDAGGEDLIYHDLIKALISDVDRAKMVAENILDAAPKGPTLVLTESIRYCYTLRDIVVELARQRYGHVPRIAVVHGPLQKHTWRVAKNKATAEAALEAGEAIDYRYSNSKRRWEMRVEQYTEAEMAAWQIPGARRKAIIEAAAARKVDILFATQLAREGLNLPHLTVGHLAMPKRGDTGGRASGASVEQEIGRIMRPDPQNPDKIATWYDYVDYSVGVFQGQYQSRRAVYRRLGLKLPKKPRTERDEIEDFLLTMKY